MKILIGIMVIDRPIMTDKCFQHLFAHTDRSQYTLVVIDNNSNDQTKDVLLKYQKDIDCLVTNPFNVGTAFGVNEYMAFRKPGQHVLNVNVDAHILVDDWLQIMLQVINYPDIATASGRRSSYWSDPKRFTYFTKNIGVVERDGVILEHDVTLNQTIFPWTMIKSSVIEQIGYMNESTCIDDLDYTARISGLGLKNVYVPDVVIWQPHTTEQHNEGQNHPEYKANREMVDSHWPMLIAAEQEYKVFKVKLYKGSRFVPESITEEFYQRASDRNFDFFKNYKRNHEK
jgi:GT2 family glycosyltransferase